MLDSLLNTFVILLVVVDPIGLAPIFAALTVGASSTYRRRMAFRSTALAALILFVFVFVGADLLRHLGIGIPAFRISGGVLLFLLAIDMVFARPSGLRFTTSREQKEAERSHDISVFPLAFPLIAGPGALTTVLLLTSGAHDGPAVFLAKLAMLLLVLAMTLASLLLSGPIVRVLGETGANVISRLLGLILAALATQFMIDGVRGSLAG